MTTTTPEYWASFWDHVEDLRKTIVRSLLIVGIGFIVLLAFYQPIFKFLTIHSRKELESNLTQTKLQRTQITNQTSHTQLFKLPTQAWLVTNLSPTLQKEGQLYYELEPGDSLLYEEPLPSALYIMGPIEGVLLVFKACLWLSFALTAPIWGWCWCQFILPGLRGSERNLLIPFLALSLIFLAIGIAFAYYVTLPLANQYLVAFNRSIGQNSWTLTYYVNYVLILCLGHGIAAELSLVLLFLVHYRFLSLSWLISMRRYMIVIAFILGAILTPPDILSQLFLALPLIALYECAILYSKWQNREHKQACILECVSELYPK